MGQLGGYPARSSWGGYPAWGVPCWGGYPARSSWGQGTLPGGYSAWGYPARGYPAQGVPCWGYPARGYPAKGGTLPGGYPAGGVPFQGGTQLGQHREYLLHGGRYGSCVHAGGLSCLPVFLFGDEVNELLSVLNEDANLFLSRCLYSFITGHSILSPRSSRYVAQPHSWSIETTAKANEPVLPPFNSRCLAGKRVLPVTGYELCPAFCKRPVFYSKKSGKCGLQFLGVSMMGSWSMFCGQTSCGEQYPNGLKSHRLNLSTKLKITARSP